MINSHLHWKISGFFSIFYRIYLRASRSRFPPLYGMNLASLEFRNNFGTGCYRTVSVPNVLFVMLMYRLGLTLSFVHFSSNFFQDWKVKRLLRINKLSPISSIMSIVIRNWFIRNWIFNRPNNERTFYCHALFFYELLSQTSRTVVSGLFTRPCFEEQSLLTVIEQNHAYIFFYINFTLLTYSNRTATSLLKSFKQSLSSLCLPLQFK